jgi:hypothetical protein
MATASTQPITQAAQLVQVAAHRRTQVLVASGFRSPLLLTLGQAFEQILHPKKGGLTVHRVPPRKFDAMATESERLEPSKSRDRANVRKEWLAREAEIE